MSAPLSKTMHSHCFAGTQQCLQLPSTYSLQTTVYCLGDSFVASSNAGNHLSPTLTTIMSSPVYHLSRKPPRVLAGWLKTHCTQSNRTEERTRSSANPRRALRKLLKSRRNVTKAKVRHFSGEVLVQGDVVALHVPGTRQKNVRQQKRWRMRSVAPSTSYR
jgi:hypothetical protein